MKTGLPLLLSTPFMPEIKAAVCPSPMRVVLLSPATPLLAMSMLAEPVVEVPAPLPNAVLPLPVVLK